MILYFKSKIITSANWNFFIRLYLYCLSYSTMHYQSKIFQMQDKTKEYHFVLYHLKKQLNINMLQQDSIK